LIWESQGDERGEDMKRKCTTYGLVKLVAALDIGCRYFNDDEYEVWQIYDFGTIAVNAKITIAIDGIKPKHISSNTAENEAIVDIVIETLDIDGTTLINQGVV